jgi:hypothetical protein
MTSILNLISSSPLTSTATTLDCKQNIHLERVKKNWGKQAFSYHAANDWNSLPVEIRNIHQIKTFKTELKKHLAT